jgi:acyl-CoA reductase-like NAD-dependent aldehyde dehydrogenase
MADLTKARWGLFIDGQERASSDGSERPVRNPATGEEVARVAFAAPADVDAAVDAARRALEAWRALAPARRGRLMYALAERIRAVEPDLARLETLCTGKPISSAKAEIRQAIEDFEYYAGAATKIHGIQTSPLPGLLAYTVKEPVGVCAQIVPWNYPFMMAAWKVAPALAAGNTVVLKPASATPITALVLGALAAEAGIPAGVLNVLPAAGATVGSALVTHPGVQKVTFTGETATGRAIMRMAADGLKRVSLELGGKSPNIVFADADLDGAAAASAYAIFYNAGQSCEARSRLLVERAVYDAFLERFVEKVRRIRVGDPLAPETQMGSLIGEDHLRRVHRYVEEAVAGGARLVTGGRRLTDGALGRGSFYAPTVLAEVDPAARAAQEEIFGPVVTVTPFEGEEEAVRFANAVEYGLAGTVWTRDLARGHRVAARVESGLIGVNTPLTALPGLPFGGYKASGFGREMAFRETLELYTETKTVLVATEDRVLNPFRL